MGPGKEGTGQVLRTTYAALPYSPRTVYFTICLAYRLPQQYDVVN